MCVLLNSVAAIKLLPKTAEVGKDYFKLPGHSPSLREIRAGNQGRALEPGLLAILLPLTKELILTKAMQQKPWGSLPLAHPEVSAQLAFLDQLGPPDQEMMYPQWTGPSCTS